MRSLRCVACSQLAYLLRETAEELVEELGEDETDILWGKRGEKNSGYHVLM